MIWKYLKYLKQIFQKVFFSKYNFQAKEFIYFLKVIEYYEIEKKIENFKNSIHKMCPLFPKYSSKEYHEMKEKKKKPKKSRLHNKWPIEFLKFHT